MAIRKRGNGWQIDYFDPNGKRVRKSFKMKKDAKAELAKREALIAENRYLDVKPEYNATWGELLDRYKENVKHQASFNNSKKPWLKLFRVEFGESTPANSIRYIQLDTYRNKLLTLPTKYGKLPAVATINRKMSCLHHIFSQGYKWELIERNPFDRGDNMQQKENNKRKRYLEKDEIQRLLSECAPHLRKIVECVLHTGMRKQEVLGLKWEQIRGGIIYLTETKTDMAREIPVNDTLAKLFQKIRQEQQLRSLYVFTYASNEDKILRKNPVRRNNKPAPVPKNITRTHTSFANALKRAGITDFRFHDLRHTFASHFVMAGGSLKALQEILGHADMKTTMRYAHLSPDHKTKAVALLNDLTSPTQNSDCHKTVTNSNF